MGATRKLQGEIDRVLKKVQEGVDVFDSIWNKVYDTENLNQKEKFEADLKKEIKKLQRYRDQIKTWIQSSEIKDKKALVDARKLIEREMERFKVCEKETKTKAFSKEGLGQQPKTDPREKAKGECRDWLNNMVSELGNQVDDFESELEGLQVKKGKSRPPRLTHLEESIVRHKAHIQKLEIILRLLDNDELTPEQVNDVKELVEDYIERNQDDFEEFSEVDDIYESLPLEKIDALDTLEAVPALTHTVLAKEKASPSASTHGGKGGPASRAATPAVGAAAPVVAPVVPTTTPPEEAPVVEVESARPAPGPALAAVTSPVPPVRPGPVRGASKGPTHTVVRGVPPTRDSHTPEETPTAPAVIATRRVGPVVQAGKTASLPGSPAPAVPEGRVKGTSLADIVGGAGAGDTPAAVPTTAPGIMRPFAAAAAAAVAQLPTPALVTSPDRPAASPHIAQQPAQPPPQAAAAAPTQQPKAQEQVLPQQTAAVPQQAQVQGQQPQHTLMQTQIAEKPAVENQVVLPSQAAQAGQSAELSQGFPSATPPLPEKQEQPGGSQASSFQAGSMQPGAPGFQGTGGAPTPGVVQQVQGSGISGASGTSPDPAVPLGVPGSGVPQAGVGLNLGMGMNVGPPGTAASNVLSAQQRMFNSVGAQWRPGLPSSAAFQGTGAVPDGFQRTEIAPDQKQRYITRYQQVQQQGVSATVLAGTHPYNLQGGVAGAVLNAGQLMPGQQVDQQQMAALGVRGASPQPGMPGLPDVSQSLEQQSLVPTGSESLQTVDQKGDGSRAGTPALDQQQAGEQAQKPQDILSREDEDKKLLQGAGDIQQDLGRLNLSHMGRPTSPPGTLPGLGPLGPGVIGRKLPGAELGAIGDGMGGLLAAGAMPLGAAQVDHALNLALLESSYANVPQPRDSERPKMYTPRHPAATPPSYPQAPLPLLDHPGLWERLDMDALFFAFYYQQGTYQQYLAARELKRQSWRYHKKYNTWFQRHEEPKITTDEYEQGTYVYFDFHIVHDDYQTGWCQRIKTEFTFEYSYLEDELPV